MAFTFEVTRVDKFPRERIGVLDGKLLEGHVIFNSSAELLHDGQRFPMHVIGVALDSRMHRDDTITLSVDLRQHGMDVVQQGDLLISDQVAEPKRRRPRHRPGRGY